jgi:hypothetical protein
MASVTAIMNEVTGDCGEGIKVSVKFKGGLVQRWTKLALLRVKKVEIFLGRENGSELAAEAGDGARYWKPFGAA